MWWGIPPGASAAKLDTSEQQIFDQAAEKALEHALALNPERARNHYEYAALQFRMGKPGDAHWRAAEKAALQALALNPRFQAARMLLARLWAESGDRAKALQVMAEGLGQWMRSEHSTAYLRYGAELAGRLGDRLLEKEFRTRIVGQAP